MRKRVYRSLIVARLWRAVLDTREWRGRFEHVIFAILPGRAGRSLAIFDQTLSPLVS